MTRAGRLSRSAVAALPTGSAPEILNDGRALAWIKAALNV